MERLKLKGRIAEKFGTNKAFAEHMAISQNTVTNVLRGKTTPTSKKMPAWCAALEIDPEEVGIFFTLKPLKTEE